MCESTVYIEKGDEEEVVLKDVVFVEPREDSVYIEDILGESREIIGRIKLIDLVSHRVVLTSE